MESTVFAALRDAIHDEVPAASAKVISGPNTGDELLIVYPDRVLGGLGSPAADEQALLRLQTMLRDGGTALLQLTRGFQCNRA